MLEPREKCDQTHCSQPHEPPSPDYLPLPDALIDGIPDLTPISQVFMQDLADTRSSLITFLEEFADHSDCEVKDWYDYPTQAITASQKLAQDLSACSTTTPTDADDDSQNDDEEFFDAVDVIEPDPLELFPFQDLDDGKCRSCRRPGPLSRL